MTAGRAAFSWEKQFSAQALFSADPALLQQPASTALAGAVLWWKVTTPCVSSAAVLIA